MRAIWLSLLALIATLGQATLASAPDNGPWNSRIQLKVMTFNIWYGGVQVSFPAVIETIRRADPDVIGIQEPDGNLERIAEAAGYGYIDPRRNIISRYPIFDSGTGERTETGPAPYSITGLDAAALHAWVMVRPGQVVAISNTHLPSDPSGPEAIRDGATLEAVLEIEMRVRVPEAQPLAVLGELGQRGVPVFLTGDFNSPSYLDWTEAMQSVRPTVITYPVDWPVSRLLAASGLRDSYREAHPDPTVRPGLTWTAGMPYPYVRPRETLDRIDFVWVGGPVRTISSMIIGEIGGPDVDIGMPLYPSDHRSVISTFDVAPVDAPSLIAVEPRRIVQGDDFRVRGHVAGSENWSVVLVARDATPDTATRGAIDELEAWRRAAHFASNDMAAGDYDAVLLDALGKARQRARFTILSRDASPRVIVTERTGTGGRGLQVSWLNAPGNRHDWIGVYGAGDLNMAGSLAVLYTHARITGTLDLPLTSVDGPLPPGAYEARLMRDDSFAILAVAPFTIDVDAAKARTSAKNTLRAVLVLNAVT
jgi:endonuclease/exonuclease/phosphatase family metal-dependent hydrolase